jgi:predicted metal-dependent phosphotriesterase family hydrolase
VLHHEHLLSLVPGPWLTGGDSTAQPDEISVSRSAVDALHGRGFNTIVDLSPYGVVGRGTDGGNIEALAAVAVQSGFNVVAGSSVYLESFSPDWTVSVTLSELTERFITDAMVGIAGTDIRAGIFGEQATSLNHVTAHEDKCLRASARAMNQTGLGLVTHTTHGTMVTEQLDILSQEGVDLTRVVIGHLDIPFDSSEICSALDAGANIACDTIGKENWDFFLEPPATHRADGEYNKRGYFRADVARADRVAALVEQGHTSQVFLSMDLTGAEVYLNPRTHGQWGYSYLDAVFLPLLRERGVSERSIEIMLHENPVRLLTISNE